MNLCQRCNKREAKYVVGGRKLCEICARDEIVKRVRKEIHNSKMFNYNDKVAILAPNNMDQIAELLTHIIGKACYTCNLKIDKVSVQFDYQGINEYIWSLIMEAKNLKEYSVKVLPFPSNFYLAYLLYSVTMKNYSYLNYVTSSKTLNDGTKIFIPLYSIPLSELSAFGIINEISFNDDVFNLIFSWVNTQLAENYELFHTFITSTSLFNYPKCKSCDAFIESGEYCARCKRTLASPSPPY